MTATGAPEPDPQMVDEINALFTTDDHDALEAIEAATLTIPAQWDRP